MEAAIGAVFPAKVAASQRCLIFVLSLIQRKHNKPNFKVPGSICDTAGDAVMNREAVKRCSVVIVGDRCAPLLAAIIYADIH